jgi:hypothetical protein
MRVIVRGKTNASFDTLQHRMKQKGYPLKYKNDKDMFFTFDLPPADSNFTFELLGLGAQLERDIKHDLD